MYGNSRVPVNKTAALVIAPGVVYEPKCKIQVEEFLSPPPMRDKRHFPTNPNFTDLTGWTKGRFKVVGLLAGTKSSTWVVRCACGTYSTRTAKSIKSVETNTAARFDACRECMHLAWLKRDEVWRRTGRDVNLEDVW